MTDARIRAKEEPMAILHLEKIRKIYPDVGECGIDVAAEYDAAQKAWVVHLKKGTYKLKTFLEEGDAEKCMLGQKCVGLGIEIAHPGNLRLAVQTVVIDIEFGVKRNHFPAAGGDEWINLHE